MNTLSRLSTRRLEKAVKRCGMKDGSISIQELCSALGRRQMSDRDIHSLFFSLIAVFEPPSCPMTHCKHYGGTGAPMNCCLERVPGHCSILRQYKKRKAERGKKSE